jgi:hypothetical protein
MSEREEYTPDLGSVRTWYSGAVGEYWCDTGMSEEEGEAAFDRAIAAHDQALREQIAQEIDQAADATIALGVPDRQQALSIRRGRISGLRQAARIARGEGSE